jgi:hypothetical protein
MIEDILCPEFDKYLSFIGVVLHKLVSVVLKCIETLHSSILCLQGRLCMMLAIFDFPPLNATETTVKLSIPP